MTRPSKFSAAVGNAIVDDVRRGLHLATAAERHGIHRDTLHEWRRTGDKEESGLFREFSDALRRAKAEAVAGMVDVITGAAKTDPRWAAWWLLHAAPHEWVPAIAVPDQKADEDGSNVLLRSLRL